MVDDIAQAPRLKAQGIDLPATVGDQGIDVWIDDLPRHREHGHAAGAMPVFLYAGHSREHGQRQQVEGASAARVIAW